MGCDIVFKPMEDNNIDLLKPINKGGNQPFYRNVDKPKRRWLFVIIFLGIILLCLSGLIIRDITLADRSNPMAYDPITLKPINNGLMETVKNFIFNSGNVLEGEQDDRVNILLLGIGGAGHDGAYLSDTNIILSIKPSTKEVAMISIPRDLKIDIPGRGDQKINAVDAYGEMDSPGQGGEAARAFFAKTFNLDIPYYVRVDFSAFQEIIDTLGGVTVNVDKSFTDASFPGPNFSYKTVSFQAGQQTMNGEDALDYARSRHGNNGEGSDFARARRQQKIIAAVKEKILSAGTLIDPVKIKSIIDSLSNHVVTNLNLGQIVYLAELGRESSDNVKTLVLDNGVNSFLENFIAANGAYMLKPKTDNFDNIDNAINNVFQDAASLASSTPSNDNKKVVYYTDARIEIQNGTWQVGLASRLEKQLDDDGFAITGIGNSSKRPIDKTVIYKINPNISADIITKLSEELKAQATTTLPLWLQDNYDDPQTATTEVGQKKYKTDTDVLVILGADAGQ